MSYTNIAKITTDPHLRLRIVTCAAMEGVKSPWGWLDDNIMAYLTFSDWTQAYDYAIENNNPEPGLDELVITDPMILSATQAILQSAV